MPGEMKKTGGHDIAWARAQLAEMKLPKLSENLTAASAVAEILYETQERLFYVMQGKENLHEISPEFYREAFQVSVVEMIQKFDPEKARGKNPCNYFTELLECRLIDKLRKEHTGAFVSVRYTDSEGNTSDRLENPSVRDGNMRTLSGDDYRMEDAEEQQTRRELALQLCSLVTYLHEIVDQSKSTQVDRLRYFRMFYTNESMGVLRD